MRGDVKNKALADCCEMLNWYFNQWPQQEQKHIIIHPHTVFYGTHTVHTPKVTVTDILSKGQMKQTHSYMRIKGCLSNLLT